MREIKFRAWDKSTKKYRYPKIWDNTMPSNWEQHYELEQFTGLKDKNGKEIYENDIFNLVKNSKGNILYKPVLTYHESGFYSLDCSESNNWEYLSYYETDSELEVIGNIHETP